MGIIVMYVAMLVFLSIAFFIFGYELGKNTGRRQERIVSSKRRSNMLKLIPPGSTKGMKGFDRIK